MTCLFAYLSYQSLAWRYCQAITSASHPACQSVQSNRVIYMKARLVGTVLACLSASGRLHCASSQSHDADTAGTGVLTKHCQAWHCPRAISACDSDAGAFTHMCLAYVLIHATAQASAEHVRRLGMSTVRHLTHMTPLCLQLLCTAHNGPWREHWKSKCVHGASSTSTQAGWHQGLEAGDVEGGISWRLYG